MSAAASPVETPTDTYISGAAILKRHRGLSRVALYRAAMAQEIKCLLLPGRPPLYSVADTERYVANRGSIQPVGG